MGKKMIGIFLCLVLLISVTACGSHAGTETNTTGKEVASAAGDTTQNTQAAKEDTSAGHTRILVAYFSRADENYDVGVIQKGNTEIIAEMIAQETGADLFKIERATPYPTSYDACINEAKKEQSDNARPQLKNTMANLDDYDVIYLGMPVWWTDMPMAVYTFVESLNWNGKTVYPFTTHAGSGLAGIPKKLQKICNGAKVEDGFAISGSDAQNNQSKAKEAVLQWIRK